MKSVAEMGIALVKLAKKFVPKKFGVAILVLSIIGSILTAFVGSDSSSVIGIITDIPDTISASEAVVDIITGL